MEASVSIMSRHPIIGSGPKERKLCIHKSHIFYKEYEEVLVGPVLISEALLQG